MINGLVEIPEIYAKFVGSKDVDGFQAVIKDFPKANEIRILTYSNIYSKKNDYKLNILKKLSVDQKIIIVVSLAGIRENTTVPNTYDKDEIKKKLQDMKSLFQLDEYQSKDITIKVCFKNHAKLIGTENVLYVGSANYSEHSYYNYEAGMLIEDSTAIREIYNKFFDRLCTVVIRNSEFDITKVSFLKSMEQIWDAYCAINEVELVGNEASAFYTKLNSSIDDIIYITENILEDADTYSSCCNDFESYEKKAENMINVIEDNRDKIPDWNMSLEELADYFESEHQSRKKVHCEDAWISEDEKYCPLRDEWDKEVIIVEYLVESWQKDKNVKIINDSIYTCIEAMEHIINEMNVFQENEVVRQGTDPSVPK